ncbi:MAG: cytochrome ubiquinol oxidase subunit I [Nitrospiraceae bacterium]|nr:cytochrome ubiquinol oxidase subunit I [Nitrospiraceae bacterium]
MDVVALSRLQFAATAGFHFIFVPLTLGLSVLTAYMETRYVVTRDNLYLGMAKFWGRLFLINFALGVVTGITMEFQFGMNWAEYSKYVGDIFGAPLAVEALIAFFLESTFIGLWVFGWDRVSKKVHAWSIWLVAIATNLSALWILLANGWMQHPVGYALRGGRAEMVNFGALVSNHYGWLEFLHTLSAGYLLSAFFVMGVSAYHLLRKNHLSFFRRSFRAAASFALASSLLVFLFGDLQGVMVAKTQPAKFAAMESVWETKTGAPYNLLVIPDTANERNRVETLGIPKFLSFMATHDFNGKVRGLKEFPPDERAPLLPVFWSFRAMIALGVLFILLSAAAFIKSRKETGLESKRLFLRTMFFALFLPYVTVQLGWIVTEMGRQPWIVYGLLKTSDAVSKSISVWHVAGSLAGFTLLYGFLVIIDVYLLARYSRKGPEEYAGY